MTKVGIISCGPFLQTGYGRPTRLLIDKLEEEGIETVCFSNQFAVDSIYYKKTPITAMYKNSYAESLPYLFSRHNPDFVVDMFDYWSEGHLPKVKAATNVPYVIWGPVDCELREGSLLVRQHEILKNASGIFIESKYGVKQMKNIGYDAVYSPKGIDSETFFQIPDKKVTLRQELGLPTDHFIVGFIGRNISGRKGICELMEAFAKFKNRLPKSEQSKVSLYLHTEIFFEGGQSMDINRLSIYFGIEKNLLLPGLDLRMEMVPDQYLNKLYNCFDVFVTCSKGEGFNLPLVEAMCAGVPVIASNNSVHTEIVDGTGNTLIPCDRYEYPLWTAVVSAYPVPSIEKTADAIMHKYNHRKQNVERGIERAKTFDWKYSYPILRKNLSPFMNK